MTFDLIDSSNGMVKGGHSGINKNFEPAFSGNTNSVNFNLDPCEIIRLIRKQHESIEKQKK